MKVERLTIKNYRLLSDFSITLENDLSLIVGKNNTGKTSLLTLLDKFLNDSERNRFTFNDFNIELKEEIKTIVNGPEPSGDDYHPLGIELRLLIKYGEDDNLANLSRIMMDLDPEHYFILLEFGFKLEFDSLLKLRKDFKVFQYREANKKAVREKLKTPYEERDLFFFLRNNMEYFKRSKKSLSCHKESGEADDKIQIDLVKENIPLKNVINFKFISARRDVTNKELNSTLSIQTSRIYEKTEATDEQSEQIEKFKDALGDTDVELSRIYDKLFEETVKKVSKFGGIKEGESVININSTLQHRDLLKGNTTVMYSHGAHTLPEYYNGLGYMNLISIIFEIEILIQEFKRTRDEMPADINILVIEEPEAHTHPQMQHVFINNIKELLKEGVKREEGIQRNLQTIISTHSSHIVAESDFDDIRYLKRTGESSVSARSLKSLEAEYRKEGQAENYKFLKQYLTLNKAELFFADKAILIEGDTERILLPAMMKKMDQEALENRLLSQNISLVEVGAYSQVFEKFMDFIGIKTLIITDIDSAELVEEEDGKTSNKACPVEKAEATVSTNSSISFFLETKDLSNLISKTFDQKRVSKIDQEAEKKWIVASNGNMQLIYQTSEINKDGETYHARSFEDAFAHINKEFLKKDYRSFPSLKPRKFKEVIAAGFNPYDFAEKVVDGKPSFAIEILINSCDDADGNQFSNWAIPSYIKEGLTWLKEN